MPTSCMEALELAQRLALAGLMVGTFAYSMLIRRRERGETRMRPEGAPAADSAPWLVSGASQRRDDA